MAAIVRHYFRRYARPKAIRKFKSKGGPGFFEVSMNEEEATTAAVTSLSRECAERKVLGVTIDGTRFKVIIAADVDALEAACMVRRRGGKVKDAKQHGDNTGATTTNA